MKSKSKTNNPTIPSSFRVLLASLQQYRAQWWLLTRLTVVVAFPSALVQANSGSSQTQDLSLTLYIISLYAVIALLSVARGVQVKRPKKIADWYQVNSARFFPVLAVGLLMMLILVPFLVGLLFMLFTTSLSLNIGFLIGGLFLICASLYLLFRFAFVLPAVMEESVSSIAAYRMSWRLTRKRFRRILAMALNFVVPFMIISVVTLIPGAFLSASIAKVVNVILTTIVLSVSLPILFIYLHNNFVNYVEAYDQGRGSKKS